MNDASYRTPGQLIAALLEQRAWDKQVLTVVLGIDNAGVSRLISGKKRVDAETAIALAQAFDTTPERFLNLQQSYDLEMARITSPPDESRAVRAALFGRLPISEMIHRGWLDVESVRDLAKVESELARFFGVKEAHDIPILPHAAKKSDADSDSTPVERAWIRRVWQIAAGMVPATRYTAASGKKALEHLSTLLMSAEEARKVPRILTECGIRFVIVEPLKSAKIDGVCFWLDDKSPVIGMSMRLDRIDNFWFVLRHEIEHVLHGHGKASPVVDADLDTACPISQEERAANEAAADFCVPQKCMEQFIARKAPLISKRDLLGFANTIRVHPGIVAGQLHNRTGRFNIFREHLVKIRSIVSPGAAVDGWGDVYPVAN